MPQPRTVSRDMHRIYSSLGVWSEGSNIVPFYGQLARWLNLSNPAGPLQTGEYRLLSSTAGTTLPRDGTIVTPGTYSVITAGFPLPFPSFWKMWDSAAFVSAALIRETARLRNISGEVPLLILLSQLSSLLIQDSRIPWTCAWAASKFVEFQAHRRRRCSLP